MRGQKEVRMSAMGTTQSNNGSLNDCMKSFRDCYLFAGARVKDGKSNL